MNMNNNIQFGEIREFISRVDGISICIKETLNYELYNFISEVPEKYDGYYLYGIGALNEPFENNGYKTHLALEIMISDKPRDEG